MTKTFFITFSLPVYVKMPGTFFSLENSPLTVNDGWLWKAEAPDTLSQGIQAGYFGIFTVDPHHIFALSY